MVNKIELLAPAGDFDSLRAAVENGADAVYLGGKLFNARQFAGNFDLPELEEALNYAHVRGVNIYLAMNTLISDSEMKAAVEFAGDAYGTGIDGIIVQDPGFAAIINQRMPDLPLHASTQMTVHNLEGAKLLERIGFKRVVLARELTLEEIREIAAGTSLEVEVFIHGALCVCYSGQCLMSSIIGGRSGNRGKCAQPCRLPYTLMESESTSLDKGGNTPRYLLSPRDLCTLPQLAEIVSSGVKSLKIEGRMKSPEYVATVVRIYRKYLDRIAIQNRSLTGGSPVNDGMQRSKTNGVQPHFDANPLPDAADLHELAQVFNRGGFTGGYIAGNTGKDLMCYEKPKNWGTLLGEAISYHREDGIVQVKLSGSLAMGDGIEVWNGENENPGTIVTFIRKNGQNVKEAFPSDIVEVGTVRGKISKGCKVYKTSDKKLLEAARESFEGRPRKRVGLKGEAGLRKDFPLFFKVQDEDGNEAAAEGAILPEKALNKPLSEERLADQLKKTGATPFEIHPLEIRLEDGLSLPVSEINEVRRKALDRLEQKRRKKYSRNPPADPVSALPADPFKNRPCVSSNHPCVSPGAKPRIALYFYDWNSCMDYNGLGADRLYIPFKAMLKPGNSDGFSAIRAEGTEVFLWTPAIIRSNYLKLIKDKMKDPCSLKVDGILAGSPSIAELPEKEIAGMESRNEADAEEAFSQANNGKSIRLVGDHSFNIFNIDTALYYSSLGFESITLSTELNLGQICEISGKAVMDIESVVYGRLPLMTSEYCPVGSLKGGFSAGAKCGGSCSRGEFRLKDRLGFEFPVICDKMDCKSTILNSNVLFAPEIPRKLAAAGVSTLRLYIWDESRERIRELVSLHRALAGGTDAGKYTALVEGIKSEGFTKGHFYKGV